MFKKIVHVLGLNRMPALDQPAFDALRANAEVLEQDQHGIKVLRLADGSMLKLFRVKRLFSSAQFFPYSARFCRNALRLVQLGIPTVSIIACYRMPMPGWTAVHYHPLPGLTLRQLAVNNGLDEKVLGQLGRFIATLHHRGIYFRSLHLGNIVLTPEGTLGLIDIADLAIHSKSLSKNKRFRNFRHLTRLHVDRQHFGQTGWEGMLKQYCESAALDKSVAEQLVASLGLLK